MAQVAAHPPQRQQLHVHSPSNTGYPEEEEDESSSIDSQDAFLDMLGLTKDADDETAPILVMEEEEDPDEDDHHELQQVVKGATAAAGALHLHVSAVPIHVPPRCSRYGISPPHCAAAVVLPNFYAPSECQALLHLAQQRASFQYITQASHTAPDGTSYTVQLQNPNPHKLAVFEHPPTIANIWNRLESYLAEADWMTQYMARTQSGPPVGLNPRLRVLQYDASDQDRFEPHFDCTTHVGNHVSHITVLLYLNTGGGEAFDGGETVYLNSHISDYNTTTQRQQPQRQPSLIQEDSDTVQVTPETGTLVLFEHDLYHAGAPLLWGCKHVMRTDVLFECHDDDDEDTAPEDLDNGPTGGISQEIIKAGEPGGTTEESNNHHLVSHLCQELQWSSHDQQVLQDMGLYGMTLEAFLLPGRGLLTEMLLDGGIHQSQIDVFLRVAKERVQ